MNLRYTDLATILPLLISLLFSILKSFYPSFPLAENSFVELIIWVISMSRVGWKLGVTNWKMLHRINSLSTSFEIQQAKRSRRSILKRLFYKVKK